MLLIIPVVGMESKVLSKPKLCVPFCLFSATLLYPMDSPQDALACSLIASIFLLAPLPSAASLCAPWICYPSLTPLSLLPKEALKCRHTDPGVCGTVRCHRRSEMSRQLHSSKWREWGGVNYFRSINSSIPANEITFNPSVRLHLKNKVLEV